MTRSSNIYWSKPLPLVRATTYQHMLESSVVAEYRFSFRASSLPICQVEYLWSKLEDPPAVHDSFYKDFYCSVGTAIHTVLQRHLAKIGVLFGNWKCTKCRKELSNRLSPLYCCETLMEYVEYSFKNKYLTGHCDGVSVFPLKNGKIEVYLNEFKSFGEQSIARPYENHLEQLNTYLNMFLELIKTTDIGIKKEDIKGMWFWYVSRKNPSNHKEFILKHDLKSSKAKYKRNLGIIQDAVDSYKSKDISKVKQRCLTRSDGNNCAWQDKCFGPTNYREELSRKLKRAR